LAWNIVITNVTKEQLSPEAVCDLYRARWQIELVFKALKSYLNIDKIGTCGIHQLECLIYGRLIVAALIFSLYNSLYLSVEKKFARPLSILRFVKVFAIHANDIARRLQLTISNIYALKSYLIRISKKGLHDKRKRKTTLEILQGYILAKSNFQSMA
jgi:hypothetical protein